MVDVYSLCLLSIVRTSTVCTWVYVCVFPIYLCNIVYLSWALYSRSTTLFMAIRSTNMLITTKRSPVEILRVSEWRVIYSADGLRLIEAFELVRYSSF